VPCPQTARAERSVPLGRAQRPAGRVQRAGAPVL